MNLYEEYPQALRHLLRQLHLPDRTQSLHLYAAIKVITDEFLEVVEAQKNDFPAGGLYVAEKAGSFCASIKSAVMPVENSPSTPPEWLKRAEQQLELVEQKIRERKAPSN
jgi:hypothetical protein